MKKPYLKPGTGRRGTDHRGPPTALQQRVLGALALAYIVHPQRGLRLWDLAKATGDGAPQISASISSMKAWGSRFWIVETHPTGKEWPPFLQITALGMAALLDAETNRRRKGRR